MWIKEGECDGVVEEAWERPNLGGSKPVWRLHGGMLNLFANLE